MRKQNKKSMLLPEEVLNLLIAVVVILLLVLLSYQLYGIFFRKTEIEQARANLDRISSKVELMEEEDEVEVLITNPLEWHLFFYDDKFFSKQCEKFEDEGLSISSGFVEDYCNKPLSKCEDKVCICFCSQEYMNCPEDEMVCEKFEGDVDINIYEGLEQEKFRDFGGNDPLLFCCSEEGKYNVFVSSLLPDGEDMFALDFCDYSRGAIDYFMPEQRSLSEGDQIFNLKISKLSGERRRTIFSCEKPDPDPWNGPLPSTA